MYKITLINMPFASLNMPSIALTQLKSVVEKELGDKVRVRILYVSHDFVHFLGPDLYAALGSVQASNAGLGDWFFRASAFPDQPDNADEYFQRYFPRRDAEMEAQRQAVLGKRASLERFLLRLIAKQKLHREDLVGFTSMFSQNVASIAMARLLKTKNSRLVTIMGGANCEAGMGRELARHVKPMDYIFSGPGLVSFPAFIKHQIAGEVEQCSQIGGVFTSENVESPHLKGPGQIGEELPIDIEVPLDYEVFLAELERSFGDKVAPYLLFETSRGCWWGERSHCTFCGLNGGTMAYRAMPSEMALKLMRDMIDTYSDRCKRFESVDNILPREYLREVFPNLETPADVSFFYEVKADLKEHEMEVLGKAQVTEIQPGIESLASSTLKLMGKGTTAFHNLAFLKGCVSYGIHPSWNLLIGFPGEKETVYEKYLRDLPILPHLPPPSGAFPVRFDRFSPYFTRAESYGLKLSPYDFYRYIYPFSEETLAETAYFFEDRNYQAEYLSHVAAWQTRLMDAVTAWRQRWDAEDGKIQGMLYLSRHEGGGTVIDTRSGEVVRIPFDPLAVAIHDVTYSKGWAVRGIAKQVKEDEERVEAEIERLVDLGLLFEENGRYMSVVIDEERQPASRLVDPALLAAVGTGSQGAARV